MKILFLSTLYPISVCPYQAPYNRQLVKALAERAEMRVMAPAPWFPGESRLRGRRLPPRQETLDGIPVSHPRIFYTPGFWIHRHWIFYRNSIRDHFRRVLSEFRPDHVVIGFAYPDGAAVAPLCRQAGQSYSVRVNGSDFRIRIRQPKFRDMVLRTLREAPLVLCPGQALKRDMAAEGVDEKKIVAFNNGVDSSRFLCRSRQEAVSELQERSRVSGFRFQDSDRLVLFVGNMAAVKGADRLLLAWRELAGFQTSDFRSQMAEGGGRTAGRRLTLVLIGDGPMRRGLERQARRLGIADSVLFPGARPHEEVALWMNVADCLCLPSRSEGMPNVVLEALASGLPVVATDAGEVPFLVRNGENGFVVNSDGGDVPGRMAERIRACLETRWNQESIAAAMRAFTWERAAGEILRAIAAGK